MSEQNIILLGDSIAFGYLDKKGGWFGRLADKLPEYRFKNLAQNGARISDVYDIFKSSTFSKETDIIFIAVGINDILHHGIPFALPAVSAEQCKDNWQKLLNEAKIAEYKVIILSLLPVIETRLPHQSWAETPVYVSNLEVVAYNLMLAEVCQQNNFVFYDLYMLWSQHNLPKLYIDACHLADSGYELYAEYILKYKHNILCFNKP